MDRRGFMGCSLAGTAGITGLSGRLLQSRSMETGSPMPTSINAENYRDLFPRLKNDVFLNAAGGIPQASFSAKAVLEFEKFWQLGPGDGRGESFDRSQQESRERFARLIGATPDEIALVTNTKAGEQIVIDSIPSIQSGGNIVTNDLHFSRSLHNLIGIRKSGVDVRIVKSRDWKTDLQQMKKSIDKDTSLVCVALVSNINGHIESIRELAEHSHRQGAKVYADIIQAAGIIPVNVREMGIDFAACSGYKWLFGTWGAGFLYVAREHQGAVLKDRLFPGVARHRYEPWTRETLSNGEDFVYHPPEDATRYQTGHVSYLGYSILNEGLKFIEQTGVENLLAHSSALVQRLKASVDPKKFTCISPDSDQSPMVTFLVDELRDLREQLARERIVLSVGGNRIRVSPAIYNVDEDMDKLAAVFNRH